MGHQGVLTISNPLKTNDESYREAV